MSDPDAGKPSPTQRPPTARQFEERVRFLASRENTDRIVWSLHAFDRVDERDITTTDALRILRTGYLHGPVEAGNKPNEWKGVIVQTLKGRREAGVAAILLGDGRLFVKTVMWIDLR